MGFENPSPKDASFKNGSLIMGFRRRLSLSADSEDLGTTLGARALCGGLPILQLDLLRVLHFDRFLALHTVGLNQISHRS